VKQNVFDYLDTLEGAPSVAGLGGEHTIYASSDALAGDTRVVEVATALCAEWGNLQDQESACALLISAANAIPVLEVRALYDVLLAAETALPQIASGLEGAFRARAAGPGFERLGAPPFREASNRDPADAVKALRAYKKLAEKAIAQLKDEEFFVTLDEEANSVAVVMKHIAGNAISRRPDRYLPVSDVLCESSFATVPECTT